MWGWLSREESSCRKFGFQLRARFDQSDADSPDGLLDGAGAELQHHVADCSVCRAEMAGLLAVRRLVRAGVPASAGPSEDFPARVMGAIAAEERRRAIPGNAWFAVPRMAARFAWAAGIVLLLASSWVYQRSAAAPAGPPEKGAALEALPEPPATPVTQDEVLLSLAERDR